MADVSSKEEGDAPDDVPKSLTAEEILAADEIDRFPLYEAGPVGRSFSMGEWEEVARLAEDTELSDRDFALRTLIQQLVHEADAKTLSALSDDQIAKALGTLFDKEGDWFGHSVEHELTLSELRGEVSAWARDEAEKLRGLVGKLTAGLPRRPIG